MGGNVARKFPDAVVCTITHAPYEVTISEQNFRLWDTAEWALFSLRNEGQSGFYNYFVGVKRGLK
jgi:hypothetical protein